MSGCFAFLWERKAEPIVIGYWKTRGLGASLRMVCAYGGIRYEDRQYDGRMDKDNKNPGNGLKQWYGEDKPRLLKLNPLVNLPYIEDGNVVVSQSIACLDYLGERLALNGRTPEQKHLNRQILCEVHDLRNCIATMLFPHKGVVETEEEFKREMQTHLSTSLLETYATIEETLTSHGGPFACGSNLCTSDFYLWEMIDQHESYAVAYSMPSPLSLESSSNEPLFKKLKTFYEAFVRITALETYFAGDAAELPINSHVAHTHGTC